LRTVLREVPSAAAITSLEPPSTSWPKRAPMASRA
jgi:hypothetical protein